MNDRSQQAIPQPSVESFPELQAAPRIPRVAVIGVHGIARHPAGETENCMADLLLSLPSTSRNGNARADAGIADCGSLEPDGNRRYKPFKAVGIHIPLQRVKTPPPEPKEDSPKGTPASFWKWLREVASFEEESARFSTRLHKQLKDKVRERVGNESSETRSAAGAKAPNRIARLLTRIGNQTAVKAPASGTQTGNEFTGQLLEGYCGGADSNVYITTRLEGERHANPGAGGGKSKVDIYEVLWADLAHPESNIVGFFLSLFTLLMHLASLSQKAVDSGSYENSGLAWSTYLWAHRWAVRTLQIFLPLFKVLLLIVFLSALPGVSPLLAPSAQKPNEPNLNAVALAVVLGVIGGIGATFAVYYKTRRVRWLLPGWPQFFSLKPWPWVWALFTLVPGTIGGFAAYGLTNLMSPQYADSILCWVVLGTPILFFILSQYEEWRNGVQFWGILAYLASLLIFFELSIPSHSVDVSCLAFWMTELGVGTIRIAWLVLCLFAILAWVTGVWVTWRQRDPEKKARLAAAVRTSRFALAMPAALFLIVTPLIWGAMFKLADWVKPKGQFFALNGQVNCGHSVLNFLTLAKLIPNVGQPDVICNDYLQTILAWGMGYQMPITLLLVTCAICILIWWVTPSVLVESFQLRDEKIPPRTSTNSQSRALGSWLSRGLDATSVVTFLFWCSIFLALPAVYLLGFVPCKWASNAFDFLKCATEWIEEHWFLAFGGAAVAAMFKYGSSTLETVLDVDTYLRSSPRDATPRAKIFERFVSTLRYVANYRDEQGQGYDKVVIVAHSLGSLIAADLLRYLYVGQSDPARRDPALLRYGFAGDAPADKIELKLLTMGAPIRQLLNRFFPYLYDWVRPVPDNSLEPLGQARLPNGGFGVVSAFPDPAELGVLEWANAYRSGDYVGRSLWLDEWYNRTCTPDNPGSEFGAFPQAICSYASPNGDRVEMCIGAGAHTRYWDDTAPDVAEQLDRMI